MSYLTDFEEINGGYVAFGRNPKGGKITSKGKIRTGKLDFDDVYFVKELKFNLFSVSQMCDKKNIVLFTDIECIILSPEFKLPDENQVLLRVPRENNMYNVDLKNIVPSGDLTCLFAKPALDESNLWHRRLGHINFKTMNKLVKVNAACYVQNRVLVTKPYNKTPYELLLGRTPSIGCMRPFGYLVTILNTLDPLGKFDGKADEGFLVGYSISSKALRVFNSRTRIVQETLHINFLENKPNVTGSGPTWLFYIDTLTMSMNYQPITARNHPNPSAGIQEQFDAEKAREENVQQYVLFPLWSSGSKDPHNTNGDATFKVKEPEFEVEKPESQVYVSPSNSAKTNKHDDKTKREAKGKSPIESSIRFRNLSEEFEDFTNNSINEVNAASTPVPIVGKISTNNTNPFSAVGPSNTAVARKTRGPQQNKFMLPDLSPTCMTLELADRLISRSVRVAEDVFVKVGTFHFPADFVVIDFDADPRVPLILRRSFLKTGRALIDMFEGELTLRVGNASITFNLDQTSRYPANYNDMTTNRIDVIDMVLDIRKSI
nr:ribonuclease H-like domain-containing protein [Tanacetum cinerariifolium]